MFNNIFNLTKIFLKTSLFKTSKIKNKKMFIFYIILLVYLAGALGFLSIEILNGLFAINQEKVFLGYILMAVVTIVLFTTIVSCVNVYYFSKDNINILSLPLKPIEILSSKINTMLVYEYIEELLIGLVPLIVYGYKTHESIFFYLIALVVLIFLPIIPLLIVSIIVMVMMAFLKGMRNKNMVQVITMTVSILFSLFFSMVTSSTSSQEDVMKMMSTANGMVEIYKKAFISVSLALEALLNKNILALLGLIVISVIAYLLVCVFTQKLFFQGVLESLSSSSGVTYKKLDERKAYNTKGLGYSYVMKEFKVYLRNPTFFVQVLLPTLILPIFIMIIIYISFTSSGENVIELLIPIYQDKSFAGIIFAVVLMTIMFNYFYSFIPLIAVSKDGHDAYLMKYIPVPFYKQLIYKATPAFMVNIFSWLVEALFLYFLFKVPLNFILLSVPVCLGFSLLHCALILIDAKKPKLSWTSEIYVAKNNLRMLWGMGLIALNLSIIAIFAFVLQFNHLIMALALTLIYVLIFYFIYNYIRKEDIHIADNFD